MKDFQWYIGQKKVLHIQNKNLSVSSHGEEFYFVYNEIPFCPNLAKSHMSLNRTQQS